MAQFGRTRKPSIEEWLLLEHGIKRRIEVTVQSFSLIPQLLLGTDRIATMHRRLARHFARTMPLRIVDMPVPLPAFTEALKWPALHNSDPASIWLRGSILEEAKRMRNSGGSKVAERS
jgi:LysR family nod box-dependent transcriptional activator